MHSVFRIQDIKQMGGNNRLYEVNLVLTADNDPELSRLTDYIRKESYPDSEGWYRLGLVLLKWVNLTKLKIFIKFYLIKPKMMKTRHLFIINLVGSKIDQGKYQEALTFYEQSLAIYKKNSSSQ